jgi:hypothetical protein
MSSADSAFLRVISTATLWLAYPWSVSAQEAGRKMLDGILNAKDGFIRIGSKGEDIGVKRWFGTEEERKKLWEHTREEVSQALKMEKGGLGGR